MRRTDEMPGKRDGELKSERAREKERGEERE